MVNLELASLFEQKFLDFSYEKQLWSLRKCLNTHTENSDFIFNSFFLLLSTPSCLNQLVSIISGRILFIMCLSGLVSKPSAPKRSRLQTGPSVTQVGLELLQKVGK